MTSPHEGLPEHERQQLNHDQALFTLEMFASQAQQAVAERSARGAEYTEDIYLEGQVDGTPFRAFIGRKKAE